MKGHLDIVKYLAGEQSAVIDAKDANGATALILAGKSRRHDVQKNLAGLGAARFQHKSEARARELAEAEARSRVAEAELLAESAVSCAGGTAKKSKRSRKARQTKDPILESLRRSAEKSLDSAEPSEDTRHAARDDAQPPTPEVAALLHKQQEHAAEVDRLSSKVDSLNAQLTSKKRRTS